MDDFNPDVYLSQKTVSQNGGGFDPDKYIAEKSPAYSSDDFERSPSYPNAKMTDPTVSDAMAVQGLTGLAKTGAGLAARGVGAGLEAVPLTKNIVPTVGDLSDDMLLKSTGLSGGQIRQVGGIEAARDAAKVGREAGLDNVFTTERGRMDALKNFTTDEGKRIGSLRAESGNASPGMLDQVKDTLMKKYAPAAGGETLISNEQPNVQKALNMIPNKGLTNADIAKGATDINNYASGEKLKQATGAISDTANELSAANNADIAQGLGSDKAKDYLEALHNESGAFHLKPFQERGIVREAISRGGARSIPQELIQKIADLGGYRTASKGLNAVHGALSETPDMSGVPLNALKAYLAKKAEDEQP